MKKNKIRKITVYKFRTLMLINRIFNIYPYDIDRKHDNEFDEYVFNREKPYLLKTIKRMQRAKVNPNIGDMINGNIRVYYIKSICYYDNKRIINVN